jgi:FMN phosphatase YigB (HAD superfamily)
MKQVEKIILFDMDGTLCDYDSGLFNDLEKLRSPEEPIFHPPIKDSFPEYVKARAELITSSGKWWANLPKFQLGFDIREMSKELGYREMILTQGPRRNPDAWSGKKSWIDKNLGQDVDITITRDKGLVYGKVLVDDFPGYIERWLQWRPRGLVIMPANEGNYNFVHPQVIRYDGSNKTQVKNAMKNLILNNSNHNL